MEIDAKKLDTAILYLQRIADGNNPVNNMPAEENSVLNNPNVIRCMHYVKEILEEVRRNDYEIGKTAKKTNLEKFPIESLQSFVYQEDKSITQLVEQINMAIDENRYKKLSYKLIQDWLKNNGFLENRRFDELGKSFNVPTSKGEQLGIRSERRSNMRGIEYMSVLYGKEAQECIVKNMGEILKG